MTPSALRKRTWGHRIVHSAGMELSRCQYIQLDRASKPLLPAKPSGASPSVSIAPICDDSDWCEIRSDGAVHCMRTESDRACEVRMGGWWHNLPSGNAHTAVRVPAPPKPAAPPLASADQRNAVYQALLDACQLSAPHEAYLLGCGLAQSTPASYATLNGNRDAVAAQLQRTFSGDVLAGVPGLFLHPAGTLGIAFSDGLLLAVRDTSGRVTRLQSRCESGDGSKVYRWLLQFQPRRAVERGSGALRRWPGQAVAVDHRGCQESGSACTANRTACNRLAGTWGADGRTCAAR